MRKKDEQNLFWLDLEMTGLDPEVHTVIEIASLVTDKNLNIIAEGPEIAINQPQSELDKMDEWNVSTHGASGLLNKVKESDVGLAAAQQMTLKFMQKYLVPRTAPLCGASVHNDRHFLLKHMPKITNFLHYRIVDVTSVSQLAARWYPDLPYFKQGEPSSHTALADIKRSVDKLSYYREHIFK